MELITFISVRCRGMKRTVCVSRVLALVFSQFHQQSDDKGAHKSSLLDSHCGRAFRVGQAGGRAETQKKDSDVARLGESVGDKGGKVCRDLNHVLIVAGTPKLFLRGQA